MVNRDWFCLAVRIFGLWLLISSIEQCVPYLIWALSDNSGIGYALSAALWFVGRLAVGLVLILFAPALAARFYPQGETAAPAADFDESKPLKVGLQLLGMYALLLAVQAAAVVIASYVDANALTGAMPMSIDPMASGYLGSLLTCGLNLAFAVILITFNEQLVTFLTKLRYVPERDGYEPPPRSE